MVSGAGPLSNLLLALLATAGLFVAVRALSGPLREQPLVVFLSMFVQLNVLLAVFNLVPLPPLDGSHIVEWALPSGMGHRYVQAIAPYGGPRPPRAGHERSASGRCSPRSTGPSWASSTPWCARPTMSRPRILSGMRPTGALHLGNYLGALENWVSLQDRYECFFSIADWHSLTTDYADTSAIRENVIDVATDWLAAGLDPARSTLFVQSLVPQHAELHLLLSMIVPVPWLERVPTYKEQQQQLSDKDLSTYGFLGYPLLQTADIIIYKANAVPVGEDQAPHVEIAREIVRRFNNLYGEVFPEPQTLLTEAKRIPGTDGRKMSKSYGNAIFLKDDPETVRQKLRPMVTDPARKRRTDPGDPDKCPVFDLHRAFSPAGDAGVGGRGLPLGRDRLPRLQGEAGRARARAPGGRPRPAPGAREAPRHRVGHPDRGVEEGPRGGRGHHGGRPRRHEDPLLEAVSDEKDKPAEAPAAAASPERVTVPEGMESVLPEDAPRIHLPLFEGPLDLLLYLIKREKIDIHDIPIAPITRQYVEYLDLMRELNLDVAGEFMVMAATLIHIKSKMLVPIEPTEAEGEEEYVDPREELVRRLLEFQRYKEAAGVLHQQAQIRAAQWTRPDTVLPRFDDAGEEMLEAGLYDLIAAFKELLDRRKTLLAHEVEAEGPPVEQRMDELLAMIREGESLEFLELFASLRDEGRDDHDVPGPAGAHPPQAGAGLPARDVRVDPGLPPRGAGHGSREAAGASERMIRPAVGTRALTVREADERMTHP